MGHIFILLTVVLTVVGQLVLKARVDFLTKQNGLDSSLLAKVVGYFSDGWVLLGFASAFAASAFWMLALSKFDLSYAYPFMSINFVLVAMFSAFVFHEAISLNKFIGLFFIVAGTIISARS